MGTVDRKRGTNDSRRKSQAGMNSSARCRWTTSAMTIRADPTSAARMYLAVAIGTGSSVERPATRSPDRSCTRARTSRSTPTTVSVFEGIWVESQNSWRSTAAYTTKTATMAPTRPMKIARVATSSGAVPSRAAGPARSAPRKLRRVAAIKRQIGHAAPSSAAMLHWYVGPVKSWRKMARQSAGVEQRHRHVRVERAGASALAIQDRAARAAMEQRPARWRDSRGASDARPATGHHRGHCGPDSSRSRRSSRSESSHRVPGTSAVQARARAPPGRQPRSNRPAA